jgi:hypothetical protein
MKKTIYMKRILLILYFLVGGGCLLQSQNRYSEIGIGFNNGGSLMLSNSINRNFKDKTGYNGLLSVHYGYNFSSNWSLLFGLEGGYVQTAVTADNITQTRHEIYDDDPEKNITFISDINGLYERNRMVNIQASFMVRYQTSTILNRAGYYLSLGIKTGAGVWNKYEAQADALILTGECDYLGQHFEDIPELFFTTLPVRDKNGKVNLSAPNISLSLETGLKYRLYGLYNLYTGIYATYSLNGSSPNKREESDKTPLISFYPNDRGDFTYVGILNSSGMKHSSISRFQAGVAIKFTFGLIKRNNKRINPMHDAK